MPPDGRIPAFVIDQSKVVSEEFNITFISFEPKQVGVRSVLDFFNPIQLNKRLLNDKFPILSATYLQYWFMPKRVNKYLRKKTLNKLDSELNLSTQKDIFIHAHCMFYGAFWAYDLHTAFGTPYLYTENNQVTLREISKSRIDKAQQVLNKAKTILTPSHDKGRQLLNLGFRFNFNFIGNLVDERVYFPKEKKESSVFKIMTIGAYHHLKDQNTIFEMLKLLDTKQYDRSIEFVYAGYNRWGGDMTNTLKKKVDTLGLKNVKVTLVPPVARQELVNMLGEADLFVFSSISEGMPLAVMEALASGIPVCTTQCGGVDELITEFNGKVIHLRDYNAMFDFTEKCIKGELKFDKQKIAQHIVADYGTEAFKRKLMKYYTFN